MVDFSDDLVGRKFGNYRLTRVLGQGGFAKVYLGEHTRLPTKAAIKVLHTHLSREQIDTFLVEAHNSAPLRHPNIVRVLDFGEENTIAYLVMDYAPSTLRQHHPRGTALPLSTIVSSVQQVAGALQYAHDEYRLIHRDVKPENMLVGPQGEILLSDFGIAQVYSTSRMSNEQPKDLAGTVTYMAPEQFYGKAHFASDQYALGIATYEWLCGTPPFQGHTYVEVALQHELMEPPSLHEKMALDRPEIGEVVRKALAKKPELRFATVQAFADALQEASRSTSASFSSHANTHLLAGVTPDQNPAPNTVIAPSTAPQSTLDQNHVSASVTTSTATRQSIPDHTQTSTRSVDGQRKEAVAKVTFPVTRSPDGVGPQSSATQTWTLSSAQDVVKSPNGIGPRAVRLSSARKRGVGWLLLLSVIIVVGSSVLWLSGVFASGISLYKTYPSFHATKKSIQAIATQNTNGTTAQVLAQHTVSAVVSPSVQANDDATSTEQANETPTAQVIANNAYPSYLSGSGTLTFVDPLSQESGSQWSSYTSSGGGCQFTGGAYHVSEEQSNLYRYCSTGATFSNFAFEVQLTITQGDCGGMIFRSDGNENYYYFQVCPNGNYDVSKHVSHSGSTNLGSGNSSAIHRGLGQQNKIALVANGSSFTFYVNEQRVSQLQDNSYTSGRIGLVASDHSQATDAAYSNARLWTV